MASTKRGFAYLWAGTGASNLADGLLRAAGPLLAASITRDPLLVSGIVVAQQAPWFVFSLFAGVIVDRVNRRTLLVAATLLQAGALATLAVALLLSDQISIVVLYLVLFGVGLAETVIDTAALAVLPRLVPRTRLEWANGRIYATQSVLNELVGPPVGGALFAVASTVAFFTGGGAFLLAAALWSLLPLRALAVDAELSPVDGIGKSIGEGLRWFWSNPIVRTVALMSGVSNLFSAASLAVLVLFATEELHLGSTGYGLLLTGGAIGGVIGGLLADRLVKYIGPGRVILVSNLTHALSDLVLALAHVGLVAGVAIAFSSFAAMIGSVVVITLRQAAIPDHLLGRVTSAYRLVALGAVPLGGLLGGLVAGQFGLRAPFFLGAGGMAVLALTLAPVLTNRSIKSAIGE